MTPTVEESEAPTFQPSGLGELSTSSITKIHRRLEVIQKAQVGSLVEAKRTKEPQEKIPKKSSPALSTRPKKYALEMWVEIKTGLGMYSPPEDDSYSVDFAIDAINHTYPGCTGMYLDVAGHKVAFYGTLGPVCSTIKVPWLVKLLLASMVGWGTLPGGESDV